MNAAAIQLISEGWKGDWSLSRIHKYSSETASVVLRSPCVIGTCHRYEIYPR
jgi:hypothetical protein